jgi:Sec-independent protein translocase protein TatA
MSFLGVGAPEAILVGIVALVVFGPKGLAEVGRHVHMPSERAHQNVSTFLAVHR